jgi:hypothetical protein
MKNDNENIWNMIVKLSVGKENSLADMVDKGIEEGMPINFITDTLYGYKEIPLEVKQLFLRGIRWRYNNFKRQENNE